MMVTEMMERRKKKRRRMFEVVDVELGRVFIVDTVATKELVKAGLELMGHRSITKEVEI